MQGTTNTSDDGRRSGLGVMPSPASQTITAGGSASFTATGYDQYGNSRGDVTGATIFSVTNGTCSGNSCSSTLAGSQTVTGNDSGIIGTATLNVTPGFITHLTLSPATASVAASIGQAYTAIYDLRNRSRRILHRCKLYVEDR